MNRSENEPNILLTEPTAASAKLGLRNNRDFVALMLANAVGDIATGGVAVAITIVLITSGHAVITVGLVDTVDLLVLVLGGLFFGRIADQVSKKRMMALGAAGNLACYALLANLLSRNDYSLSLFVTLIAASALSTSAYTSAARGALRVIVGDEQLARATAITQARAAAAMLIGPILGASLAAAHPSWPFWFNALSFAGTLLAVISLRSALQSGDVEPLTMSSLFEGISFVARDSVIRSTAISGALLKGSAVAFILISAVTAAGNGDPHGAGITYASYAAGIIVGAIVYSSLSANEHNPYRLARAGGWAAASFLLAAVLDQPFLHYLALASAAATFPVAAAEVAGIHAARTPLRRQATVASTDEALTDTFCAPIPLLGAFVYHRWGIGTAQAVAVALALSSVIPILAHRAMAPNSDANGSKL